VYPFTDGTHDTGEFHTGHVRGQPSGRVVAVALHEVGRVDPAPRTATTTSWGPGLGVSRSGVRGSIVDDDAAHPVQPTTRRVTRPTVSVAE